MGATPDAFPHRGHLYWVDLEPGRRGEPGKRRPCIVISNDLANQFTPISTIIPTTTQASYVDTISLSQGETGFSEPSTVLVEHIRSVHRRYMDLRPITVLTAERLADVEALLVHHLDLSR